MKKLLAAVSFLFLVAGCVEQKKEPVKDNVTTVNESVKDSLEKAPFAWEAANIYFLLTDRFNNGNPDNDLNFDRNGPTVPYGALWAGISRASPKK